MRILALRDLAYSPDGIKIENLPGQTTAEVPDPVAAMLIESGQALPESPSVDIPVNRKNLPEGVVLPQDDPALTDLRKRLHAAHSEVADARHALEEQRRALDQISEARTSALVKQGTGQKVALPPAEEMDGLEAEISKLTRIVREREAVAEALRQQVFDRIRELNQENREAAEDGLTATIEHARSHLESLVDIIEHAEAVDNHCRRFMDVPRGTRFWSDLKNEASRYLKSRHL